MTQHECANSRVRRWRRVVVTPATWLWQGADRLAAADFTAFGRAIADLMELRLAQQPRCQVELFLLGDGAASAQRVRAAG